MKKCSRCSKPATLHITELREGVVDVLHLCESCAHEYLSNAQPEPEPAETAASGLSGKIKAATSDRDLEELDQLTCPNCGISFREFRSQGRLGCPHDYIAFRNELLPLLENIHGETQHTGKLPKRAPGGSRRQYRLIKLRSNLRDVVEQEDYEAAAQLRDEIQALEVELEDGTPDDS
jgi:protein arginine kinase activator